MYLVVSLSRHKMESLFFFFMDHFKIANFSFLNVLFVIALNYVIVFATYSVYYSYCTETEQVC